MKTFQIGQYTLTIEPKGARVWYSIYLGKLPIITKNEGSEHRAFLRALNKLETLINL